MENASIFVDNRGMKSVFCSCEGLALEFGIETGKSDVVVGRCFSLLAICYSYSSGAFTATDYLRQIVRFSASSNQDAWLL